MRRTARIRPLRPICPICLIGPILLAVSRSCQAGKPDLRGGRHDRSQRTHNTIPDRRGRLVPGLSAYLHMGRLSTARRLGSRSKVAH